MSRVPVTLVQAPTSPVVAEVFERLSKGPLGVVNLHRTIANSPDVFAAFIGLAHALRFKTKIPPALRELAILRVLTLHHGDYEAVHHARMAVSAGATDAQVAGARADAGALDASLYDAPTRAALAYAEAFAAGAGVAPEVAAELTRSLDNQTIVELTWTLSLYLGLAHVTSSIDIPHD